MRDANVRSPAKIARRLKLWPLAARVVENWPSFMYHYALGSVPAGAYEFRNGARIQIGRGVDHVPIIEIFLRQDYGTPPDDAVIVDLGAHIGVFAIYAAVTARNARVYAYEPMASFYRLMQDNVRLNCRADAISGFNCAVAGASTDRELYLGGTRFFFPTLIAPEGAESAARTPVRCTTLDDIVAVNALSRVDLLKIDIEGAEYEVLYRARGCFEQIHEIRMEYHTIDGAERNVEGLKRFLTGRGYRITHERANTPTNGNLWAVRR